MVEQSSTPPAVVRCRDVRREYVRNGSSSWRRKSTQPTVTALDGVSLHVQPGEILGVTGPSGSGKSTLLHLLAALDTPTSGTIEVDGEDISDLSQRQRARLRLSRIGIVFQQFHLLSALTARENVALPLVEQGISRQKRRRRAENALEAVGLGDRTDHRPGELSGGEQQRVAIARATITDPLLIVADEPTGELDTATGERVLDVFESIASEDRAVVLASHDDATIARAHRVVELTDGTITDEYSA